MKSYTVITHDGDFHQDELFAIALLERFLIGKDYRLIRTREEDIIDQGKEDDFTFVIDIGREYEPDRLLFDHHQKGCPKYWSQWKGLEDIPYSSTGLIYDYLKENDHLNSISDIEKEYIENQWIIPIDAMDNGVKMFYKLGVVTDFMRRNVSSVESDIQFSKALKMVRIILDNVFEKAKEHEKTVLDCRKIIDTLVSVQTKQGKHMIIAYAELGEQRSIAHLLNKEPEIDFFVSERKSGEYSIQTAPLAIGNNFSQKHPMPIELIDKAEKGKNLDYLTEGGKVVFIHKAGFLSILVGTKENAFKYIENVF